MLNEFTGRGLTAILGLAIGALSAWLYGRWRRHKQRQSILKGDARDTVVVEHHLVETATGPDGAKLPATLRMRSLGQDQVDRVVPNGHLAAELMRRAWQVTPAHTLISMEGAEGSYLLETLTNFVCDRVANGSADHDLYVMAPCCEPAELAVHQPITIILIAVKDLRLFETWEACRDVRVEHGSDGARVLTLMELARRFGSEQLRIRHLREAGERTTTWKAAMFWTWRSTSAGPPSP
jgi:hypothetical protein